MTFFPLSIKILQKYCHWNKRSKKKNMMASNRTDQESENSIFSHGKQLLCAISDLANSCLIIYCHSHRHGQQAECGDAHILCFPQLKQQSHWLCTAFHPCSPFWSMKKTRSKIWIFYLLTGVWLFFSPKSKGPDVLMMQHHMTPGLPRQAVNPAQLTLLVTALNSWGTHSLAPW